VVSREIGTLIFFIHTVNLFINQTLCELSMNLPLVVIAFTKVYFRIAAPSFLLMPQCFYHRRRASKFRRAFCSKPHLLHQSRFKRCISCRNAFHDYAVCHGLGQKAKGKRRSESKFDRVSLHNEWANDNPSNYVEQRCPKA
jgi:hypothetical protein